MRELGPASGLLGGLWLGGGGPHSFRGGYFDSGVSASSSLSPLMASSPVCDGFASKGTSTASIAA